jgi:hypothetical protein
VTTWQISESAASVTLRGGMGNVTFTITNGAPVADRVVLTVRALDGAADAWFTVDRPQRAVDPGASVLVPVAIAPPGGTAIGTYGLQGIAYSGAHLHDRRRPRQRDRGERRVRQHPDRRRRPAGPPDVRIRVRPVFVSRGRLS